MMSRFNLSRNDRVAQMTKQEELIAKKKLEILEKQKTAELAKQVVAAQGNGCPNSTNSKPNGAGNSLAQNNFKDDGSFLENFKKITEAAKQATASQVVVGISSGQNSDSTEKPEKPETPLNPQSIEATPNASQQTIIIEQSHLPITTFDNNQIMNSVDATALQATTTNQNLYFPNMNEWLMKQINVPIQFLPPQEPINLCHIPTPGDLDLNAIPKPEINLDAIQVPAFSDNDNSAALYGDGYEDKLRSPFIGTKPPEPWLLNKQASTKEMDTYVVEQIPKAVTNEIPADDDKYDPEAVLDGIDDELPAIEQSKLYMNENIPNLESNNSDFDSDSEYMMEAKERNLANMKRKISNRVNERYSSDSDEDDDFDDDSKSSISTRQSGANSNTASNFDTKSNKKDDECTSSNSNRSNRRKRSRWGEKVETVTTITPAATPVSVTAVNLTNAKPMLSQMTRTNPALLAYARQNYGSTNLTEDEWKKCEDHFKVNLLYQDMLNKRKEIERLAKMGKFKYEYDSDEDTTGGTWEHKLRMAEMEATHAWADALNKQSEGKHHIGDFLPPEELKKFMEQYDAQKNNREPDISDYKEYKLKEDNIGFQMLQKLGWKEGQGLGTNGSGIVNPINKSSQRDSVAGLGATPSTVAESGDNEYDAYRKRMMLAYRFRPNPLNNPRRAYY